MHENTISKMGCRRPVLCLAGEALNGKISKLENLMTGMDLKWKHKIPNILIYYYSF